MANILTCSLPLFVDLFVDPLKQFEIHSIIKLPNIFGHNIDFTNASLYTLLAALISCLFLWLGIARLQVIPRGMQCIAETLHDFISSLIKSTCGNEGLRYIGLVMTIFLFILSCNLAGILPLPLSFTVTSHIAITFSISLFIFFFVTVVGIMRLGRGFFAMFLPGGTPWWLAPLMVPLELCTYFFRPVSLSIRLAANMVAGHIILKVIAGFVLPPSAFVSPLSFVFVVILILFELFVAVLQAYIFVVLTCVYLSDALVKH